jgi:tRNA(fMet)-specific endonuclease VapC
MQRVVADTDVLIDALHGRADVARVVAERIKDGTLATTVLTLFELEVGAATEAESAQIHALLGSMRLLALDPAAARVGAAVERALRRRGLQIGTADALIAGLCLAEGLPLLTRNRRHFAQVPGLALVPLPA